MALKASDAFFGGETADLLREELQEMDSEFATPHASPVKGSGYLSDTSTSDESPSAMDTECTLDKRSEDLEEEKSVSDLKKATCGCSCSSGGPCSNLFSANYLMDYRNSCSEMTSTELDLAILSAMACARARLTTRTKTTYIHQGKHICMKVFLYLHGISRAVSTYE